MRIIQGEVDNSNVYVCMPDYKEEKIKGVVYFCHGLTEYGMYHKELFEVLTNNEGYCVITNDLFDNEEHYKNWNAVHNHCVKIYEKGLQIVHSNMNYLYGENFAICGVGFSFGSYVIQSLTNTINFDKIVLIGSGEDSRIKIYAGKTIAKILSFVKNKKVLNRLMYKIFFEAYNKEFEQKTKYDWLSADHRTVVAYLKDNKCDKHITPLMMKTLFEGMLRTSGVKAKSNTNEVLLLSGFEDPVSTKPKVRKMCQLFAEAEAITDYVFYHGRHDILKGPDRAYAISHVAKYLLIQEVK